VREEKKRVVDTRELEKERSRSTQFKIHFRSFLLFYDRKRFVGFKSGNF
jgi:hypothetical protein